MKKNRRIAAVVSFSLLCALVGYGLYILTITGQFKTIDPHFKGTCRTVDGVVGSEDIVILADGSGALISSNDRRAHLAGNPTPGAIFYYDLTQPGATPVNLTPDAPATFHPHGIGLHEGDEKTLFVVNHPRADVEGDIPGEGEGPAHSIEVFDLVGKELKHRRSIADEKLLIAPNDVAPVGPEQFYVTNDHGSGHKLMRTVEDYLRLARSHLLFFDGSGFSRLPGEYRYANGVIASRNGRRVYLSAPAERAVFVFDRDPDTNKLTLATTLPIGTGGDNIDIDADGDLWIGAHPQMLSFKSHVHDASSLSPSQVLRLRPDGDASFTIDEIMLSDGTDLSASSSAARYGNRLLVGSVFGPAFLDCEMAP